MSCSISPKLLLPFVACVALVACNGERHAVEPTPTAVEVTPTATPIAVPAAFQPLYDELQTRLEAAQAEFAGRAGPGQAPSLVLEFALRQRKSRRRPSPAGYAGDNHPLP